MEHPRKESGAGRTFDPASDIEIFVGKEIMEEPLEQYDKMLSPAVQFDFKNVTFTFLPHQVNDMDILVKDLESKAPEIVGVASYEQCKAFVETLSKWMICKVHGLIQSQRSCHSLLMAGAYMKLCTSVEWEIQEIPEPEANTAMV